MSQWKEYKLNEVFTFGSGLSKPRSEFGFGSGFLSYKDIFHNYFVPKNLKELVNSTEKEQVTCSIKKGDVFLTRTSETDEDLGMSCVALKDYPNATFNGFTKRLRPNGIVEIVPEYAGFYFRNPIFRATISGISSITTRASLNNEMLASLSIIIPPPNEQKEIAETLKSIHDKIDLLHSQNKTLEQLAETVFRQWFMEEAEEGWEKTTFGEFVKPKKGRNITKADAIEGDYAVVAGGLEPSCYHNQSNTSEPVITVSSSGANAGFVRLYHSRVWASDCSFIDDTITSYVFFSYVFLKINQEILFDKQEGSAQPHVYPSHIMEIEMFKYPKSKIEMFEEEITPVFQKIKSNTIQIKTLTQLRDTLLPKLISGEVKITINETATI